VTAQAATPRIGVREKTRVADENFPGGLEGVHAAVRATRRV
jgi:hypothetical protein